MRNYVRMFLGFVEFEAGSPPVPQNPIAMLYPELDTPGDFASGLIQAMQAEAENLTYFGFHVTAQNVVGAKYLLLDKSNLADFTRTYVANFGWTGFEPWFFKETGSPRNGWTDEAGVKRLPTPSDKKTASKTSQDLSGSASLVKNFIDFMDNLVASLQARKLKRDALIVQDLLNQFLAGKLSITEILVRLEKSFIVT